MNDYENKILEMLQKEFSQGEHHYAFDLPSDPIEYKLLCDAIKHLEALGHIIILQSPEYTGDDYIEVEKFPPCCKRPNINDQM